MTQNTKHRQAFGVLLHVATFIRPEICAAVGDTRKQKILVICEKRNGILEKHTLKLIIIKNKEPTLASFSDSDSASNKHERK